MKIAKDRIPDIYHARLTDDGMEDSIQWLNPENDGDELPEKFIPPASAQEALMRAALSSAIESGRLQCDFTGPSFNINEAFRLKTFQALAAIRAILDDDTLDDFMCVEKIVQVFEWLGSGGGSRHDFG